MLGTLEAPAHLRFSWRARVGGALAAVLASLLVACSGGGAEPGGDGLSVLPRVVAVSVAPYASVDQALADASAQAGPISRERREAITLAHAARELADHLAQAGWPVQLQDSSAEPAQPALVLALAGRLPAWLPAGVVGDTVALGEQGHVLQPRAGSLLITANAAVGVMYGVYGLLDRLGFAWHDPWETLLPEPASLAAPRAWARVAEVPRLRLRGYWTYGDDRLVPDAFALWMARNRQNVVGRSSAVLRHKLGLKAWGAEHSLLQQEFSRPGLFEQHPQWFAMVNGLRRPVDATGTYFNPAFGNAEAAAYFVSRLVPRLESGDLQWIDLLNIWPADDRFNRFDQSPEALALGNPSDNLLQFNANVASGLAQARARGELSRPVTVAGISYFLTMAPPTNAAVLQALAGADYVHLFYPIERDWAGPVDATLPDRDSNRQLLQDMAGWAAAAPLQYGVVDYHNLSSFAALALTDHLDLAHNLGVLGQGRGALYGYMHPLLQNPGPRRLTNRLLAALAWDDAASAPVHAQRYFAQRFGVQAGGWQAVYDQMARSLQNAKELFGTNSLHWLLLQRQIWSTPFYTPQQVAEWLPRYRAGGAQDLPAAFSGAVSVRARFIGLDESLGLQAAALQQARALRAQASDPQVQRRMDQDLLWWEATASRYRLMAAACDHAVALAAGQAGADARARMQLEVDALRNSPVTADTVSPVDQRAFLAPFVSLLAGG